MNEPNWLKLWVIKFCLKIIYPKFNLNTFLVFLAIKYRYSHRKLKMAKNDTNSFELITVSSQCQQFIIKEHLENKLDVLVHKCLIISRESYIQLAAENLFYIDNGVLWLFLKVTHSTVQKYKKKRKFISTDKNSKYNFNFMTTEIHKKLWANNSNSSIENIRIVPVLGSKLVDENIAFTCENEYLNIMSSFGLNCCDKVKYSLHPLSSFEYAPKIAVTAEVNLIVNDYDLSNDFVKEILNNYFETPKLLSPNDVFSIDLSPTVTTKYQYKYIDLITATGKLFFKCSKFSSTEGTGKEKLKDDDTIQQAYFIVRGVTQLSLGDNIHALKPKDEYLKLNSTVSRNVNLSLCPTGLKQSFDDLQDTIRLFVNGEINPLSSSLSNPIVPMLLITGLVGSGRHLLIKCLAKYNGMNCLQLDCNAIQSSTAKQTESKINSAVQKAKAAAPVIVILDNFEVFAVDPENNEDCRIMEYFTNTIADLYQNYTKHPIIFIAVCEKLDLKPNILRIFLEKFNIPRLGVQQRYEILHWFVLAMNLGINGEEDNKTLSKLDKNKITNQGIEEKLSVNSKDVLHRVAAKTETFLYGDIDTLVHFAMRESYLKQINSIDPLPSDPNLKLIQEEDFETALDSIRSLQSQHLDAPKIPKVYWEDIGGLEKLKKELLKTIEFPIKYSHLFKNSSLKRSGILLYGPPGCGKTLVAKAVSTELNVSFLSVKGPELLNMYIGQSEENVRRVFESARASSPCIVFLDELDALAPRRGAAGDSGGASDRVVSQLLAEVDGVASGEDADTQSFVFIMGATNRPDLLEQSLLRPGRLDKLIYVGPYSGVEEKTCVLKALCRSYKVRQEVNLEQVAAALPDRCTGADLLQVVSTARSAAVRALVAKLHAGTTKESELSPDSVVLGVSELWQGVEAFRPSVTEEELAYYESLQAQM